MCNGISSRQSKGGAMIVLRPVSDADAVARWGDAHCNCTVCFSENASEHLAPEMEFTSCSSRFMEDITRRECHVVIHQSGDLTVPSTPCLSNALYSFPIGSMLEWDSRLGVGTDERRALLTVPVQMSLDVGGKGIIGRKLSIVSSVGDDAKVIAEGIVGRN